MIFGQQRFFHRYTFVSDCFVDLAWEVFIGDTATATMKYEWYLAIMTFTFQVNSLN